MTIASHNSRLLRASRLREGMRAGRRFGAKYHRCRADHPMNIKDIHESTADQTDDPQQPPAEPAERATQNPSVNPAPSFPIRALATDYDGTLAHHGTATPETMAALQRLKAAGFRLILVTGRELHDLV